METKNTDLIMQNKVFLWIALGTVFILLIPLIAMQFTSAVNWGPEDFIVMGTLLFGAGSIFVTTARIVPRKYRLLIGFIVLTAFLLTWAHLAVGIVEGWPLAGS